MIIAAGLLLAAGSLALIMRELRKAPAGYEDEHGFYILRKHMWITMSQTQRQRRLAEHAAARIGPCTAGMRTKPFAAFAEATDLRIAAGALKLTGGPYLEFQGSGYANFTAGHMAL